MRAIDPRLRFYPPFPDFFLRLAPSRSSVWTGRVARGVRGNQHSLLSFGKGLRNEVRYINIDRHRDWLLHDYHREARARTGELAQFPAGLGSDSTRLSGLGRQPRGRGDSALVVTRVNPAEGIHNIADSENFPIERRWAESHPERFEPLYGAAENDPWFRLYRFAAGRIGNRSTKSPAIPRQEPGRDRPAVRYFDHRQKMPPARIWWRDRTIYNRWHDE